MNECRPQYNESNYFILNFTTLKDGLEIQQPEISYLQTQEQANVGTSFGDSPQIQQGGDRRPTENRDNILLPR